MYGLSVGVPLLAAVVYTNAAVALFPVSVKPAEFADQEGCYLSDQNKVIPYGDYYPKKLCVKYTCNTNNVTHLVTCGVQSVDKRSPCHIVSGNTDADYPSCCPWVMCSTIPPEALTSEPDTTDASVDITSEPLETEAPSTSEAVTVETPATSEAKSLDFEGPSELLIAQASLNQ